MTTIIMHYAPQELGKAAGFMAYLSALHSVSAMAVAGLWIRVWLTPEKHRISLAALCTAILLLISAFRLSSAVVLRSGV